MEIKKLIIILISILMLCGCSSPVTVTKDKDELYVIYQDALDKNDEANNVTSSNQIDMSLTVSQIGDLTLNQKTTTQTSGEKDSQEMYMDYISTISGFFDEAESITTYYKDGVLYIDYGGTKLKSEDDSNSVESVSDADIQQLIISDYIEKASYEEKDGNTIITFVLNDKGCSSYLNAALTQYLTIEKLKVISNSTVATVNSDGYLVSEVSKFDVEFALDGDENLASTMQLTSTNEYTDFGTTVIKTFDNLDEYVDINDINDLDAYLATGDAADSTKGDTYTETLANRLVSWLGYSEDSTNVYSYVFNDNETYKFDFNNKIFSYINGKQVYSYNWVAQIGVYDSCTYHYDDESTSGDCNDTVIEKLNTAKDNFDVELIYCEVTLDQLLGE